MEESTWADSMDSVCEGGAECACSDRTDANVEHGERRNVHTHLLRYAHMSFVRISRSVNIYPMAVKCKIRFAHEDVARFELNTKSPAHHVKLSASLLLSHDRRPRKWFTVAYHQGDRPSAPHRSRIGVPSALLGLANLRLVESAPDGDADIVLDMFKHQD